MSGHSHRRRVALAAASSAALLTAVTAHQASAQEALPATDVEEIIVTGVRASLRQALATKRTSVEVVDSILAEDIADFPQSNLAEALQRVSGVQIRRDFAGGIGNEVSIRGLQPELTQVVINGQSAPSDAESRVYNFNVLPAELFRRVDVFKTVTAAVDEGGIGGTVSLETLRPLDFGDRRGVVTVDAVHNAITGETTPNATLVYGRTWGGRGGALIGLAYSEFSAASQSFDAVRWTRRNFDTDGNGSIDATNVFLLDLPRYVHEQQNVERFSATVSGQYRFNDDIELLVDGLYIDARRRQDRLTPIWFFDGATGLLDIEIRDGVAEYAEFNNVRYRSENNTDDVQTETYQIGARMNLTLGDWKLQPFVSTNRSTNNLENWRFFADRRSRASYDTRQDDNYFTITVPYDIADPTGLTMSEARHNTGVVEDREVAAGFDVDRDLGLLELDIGFKFRDRSKERRRFGRTITGLTDAFAPFSRVFDDFLTDQDGAQNGPNAFAVHDFDLAIDFYRDRLDLSASEQVNNFYDVDERISSAYASLSYDRGPVLANLGVRVAETQVTSTGTERLRPANIFTARTVEQSYTDVLPSLNLRYELRPDLFLRFAAGRTLTRPSLGDLAAYREINESNRTISARNPDLDPIRADAIDLALEWYFNDESVLALGYFSKDVTGFIANETQDVVLNGVTYRQTIPVNINNAKISGFEFNYQQPFSFLPAPFDGLGVVFNYTYTDASFEELSGAGGNLTYDLPNNSRDNYNIILYYENDIFNVRVAHTFRGVFLREVPNEQDGLKYRDDYGQTDLSARYNLTDRIGLTLDVQNLFDAVQEEYIFEERLTDGTFSIGRTIQLGVRARF